MTIKDKVLLSFLEHNLITDKYKINKSDIPKNLREALNSEHTIIKTIALIIDELESAPLKSDESLRRKIIAFLNEATS